MLAGVVCVLWAILIPPALPRPPIWTWALITHG